MIIVSLNIFPGLQKNIYLGPFLGPELELKGFSRISCNSTTLVHLREQGQKLQICFYISGKFVRENPYSDLFYTIHVMSLYWYTPLFLLLGEVLFTW